MLHFLYYNEIGNCILNVTIILMSVRLFLLTKLNDFLYTANYHHDKLANEINQLDYSSYDDGKDNYDSSDLAYFSHTKFLFCSEMPNSKHN